MFHITEEQVVQGLPMSQAILFAEEALKAFSEGTIVMGTRGTLEVDPAAGDSCIFLPSFHREKNLYTMKYAASFPSCASRNLATVQSTIWVFSGETGQVLAMIDANAVTAIKTGAASAVAAKYLSRQDAKVLTLIGAGEQAFSQLAALCTVRDLEEIHLVDLDRTRCEKLKEYAQTHLKITTPFTIHSSADEVLPDTDILITVTTSLKPVLNGALLSPGTHINAIGSFTPLMQEIDLQTIQKADLIAGDSAEEVWNCAGDLLVPKAQGLFDSDPAVKELGDIIRGKTPGRTSKDDITLYESVGFAPLDLAMALALFEGCCKK